VSRLLSFLEKAIIFIISFAIVTYGMFRFRIWGSDFTKVFFMTDRWPELIFVILVTTALSMFLTWLLRLEFRILADVRER